jgi:peroxiredoxin
VNNYIKDNNYTFPVHFESTSIPTELISNSIPTTFIIDKSGKIIMKKKGASDWNSKQVRTFLDKNI